MEQTEREQYLIKSLLEERGLNAIPSGAPEGKKLLRALFNLRMPKPASAEFLRVQDGYLQEELRKKGITDAEALVPVRPDIYLWKGDITTLRCDAIVNAANAQMLGCFCPDHGCIDNAIHTFAGIRLRQECAEFMEKQASAFPAGRAHITRAYNLPCKYVLHTVGPIVGGALTRAHEETLADCYRACLALAEQNNLQSVAFCCISTGEFRFPNGRAAEIAVKTVADYKAQTASNIKIIFNVFKELDYEIYQRILRTNQ